LCVAVQSPSSSGQSPLDKDSGGGDGVEGKPSSRTVGAAPAARERPRPKAAPILWRIGPLLAVQAIHIRRSNLTAHVQKPSEKVEVRGVACRMPSGMLAVHLFKTKQVRMIKGFPKGGVHRAMAHSNSCRKGQFGKSTGLHGL
jgi:hypothetical protein